MQCYYSLIYIRIYTWSGIAHNIIWIVTIQSSKELQRLYSKQVNLLNTYQRLKYMTRIIIILVDARDYRE